MNDKLYTQLQKHYNDAFDLEPTRFNNPVITRIYKFVGYYIKHSPFRIVVPLSLVFSLIIYVFFGVFIIRVVSFFQHGF